MYAKSKICDTATTTSSTSKKNLEKKASYVNAPVSLTASRLKLANITIIVARKQSKL